LLFLSTTFIGASYRLEKPSLTYYDRNTLYVGGGEPGNYTKIQDAIDDAGIGDTIFVYDVSSPYYENIIINKTINLTGENKHSTVIDGAGEDVVWIVANNVSLSGFTIQTGRYGMRVISSHTLIFENIIIYNGLDGILMTNSSYNTISNNIVQYNHLGIYLYRSQSSPGSCFYNNIINNTISENYYQGIQISLHQKYNNIIGNTITKNKIGIKICCASHTNIIYHNNFKDNDENANDENSNTWHNGYPSGGNYWDDYNGTDEDGDGIGDTSYLIPGGYNLDKYPLMAPWENHPPNAPDINGPARGKVGVEYTFVFSTTDLDEDNLSYFVDWGDGTNSSWIGEFESGQEILVTHNWTEKGEYVIKAKAKDIYNAESEWTVYYIFDVSKSKQLSFFSFFQWLNRFLLLQRTIERLLENIL
jgi:parallel beta-helix repeat protein